jgi:hypothetical protein
MLKAIQEINKIFQNNGYLLSHVGVKLFHLNARVHVICNINLCLQLSSFFYKVAHIICLLRQHFAIVNTHNIAIVNTHVNTIGERSSQMTLVIAQVCAKGIMLAKGTISW